MTIIGISAFYHDSAVCVVEDGDITFAAQEERFSRKKHDPRFPKLALQSALENRHISIDDVDYLVFYDKPIVKFERILETHFQVAPFGSDAFQSAMPSWIKQKLWLRDYLRKETGFTKEILFTEHHEAHAASAFFASPFKRSAFLTVDGVGEWTTTSWGIGRDNKITPMAELQFPHSLGLLYSAFTYYLGFKVNSGEYKIMGLAPYGEPKYVEKIYDHLIDLKPDGSLRLNLEYFNFVGGLTMTNEKFDQLFGAPPRNPESRINQRIMDIARSLQEVTDEAMMRMARHIYKETKEKNLCLAGGVALNCVANGKILREGPFENIWIQPAAGDAGGALGSALSIWYQYLDNPRKADNKKDFQHGSYLGPSFNDEMIETFLKRKKIAFKKLKEIEIASTTAELIAKEMVVGWFQGKMEFGPRALGARSIIGDARSTKMQKIMNLKIKYRESFRPFAPSVISEKSSEYFEINSASPYMLLVAEIRSKFRKKISNKDLKASGFAKLEVQRSTLPAITHVDYTARLQTVHADTNPRYHAVISAFYKKTKCPVIINTSFNVRGEPIVCTPEDAYRCFMHTEMDYLVLGSYLVSKKDMPKTDIKTKKKWRDTYPLD